MSTTAPHPVVEACAQARAEVELAPYTIRMAIEDARRLRANQDAIVDTAFAKRLIGSLLSAIQSSPCFLKAVQNSEEVFVLRQVDRAAPDAINRWADVAQDHGCSEAKILDARRIAHAWDIQDLSATKWPT